MEEVKQQETTLTVQTDKLLHATKKELSSKVSHAVQLVKNGDVDKMQAYIYAKKLEVLGKDLSAQLKELADDTTIEKGGVTLFNALITQGEQGVKWDYSECGDPEWEELDKQFKEVKEKKDAREKFLQGITKKTTIVDEDFVTHDIHPPVKSGRLGLTVKLK